MSHPLAGPGNGPPRRRFSNNPFDDKAFRDGRSMWQRLSEDPG